MKIKYAIIAATILAAASITSVKTIKNATSLFEANVEALANAKAEEYTVYGHCSNQINSCLAKCPNCDESLVSVPDLKGPSYDVHGTCPNCHGSL